MNLLQSTLGITLVSLAAIASAELSPKPNVVIIYGDDVGYADVSINVTDTPDLVRPRIPTPNIDGLAEAGLNFTDGHCSASTCTPSRYSLLTGVHAFRSGVFIAPPNASSLISEDQLTLPKLMKQAGYKTGIVGKWHLGLGEKGIGPDWNGVLKPGPMELGFDSSFILPTTPDRVPCVYVDGHRVVGLDAKDPIYVADTLEGVQKPGSTQYPTADGDAFYASVVEGIGRIGYMSGGKTALWDDYTMADMFVGKARSFIAESKDEPFFLFFSSQDIHIPNAPHPRFQGKSGLGARGDAMVQLDWAVGVIMEELEAHGLSDNTIVIFSSDNGPTHHADEYPSTEPVSRYSPHAGDGHDASGKWRGGKYEVYEGSTRVPLMIRWPDRIEPGTTSAMVSQIDFIASFAELLELDIVDGQARDSRSTLSAFMGVDPVGLPFMIEEGRGLALRVGDWKYIRGLDPKRAGGFFPVEESLFDLSVDVGEQENVFSQNIERGRTMAKLLDKVKKSAGIRNLAHSD